MCECVVAATAAIDLTDFALDEAGRVEARTPAECMSVNIEIVSSECVGAAMRGRLGLRRPLPDLWNVNWSSRVGICACFHRSSRLDLHLTAGLSIDDVGQGVGDVTWGALGRPMGLQTAAGGGQV